MVSHYTTLDPSLGLHIGPACEAGLSAGMQRERVPPHRRKKERSYLFIICLYTHLLLGCCEVHYTIYMFVTVYCPRSAASRLEAECLSPFTVRYPQSAD